MSLHGSEPVTRVGGLSKRAPRACESCRFRKVRCDVTRTKAPCTNCRLDSKNCVLPASRRRHVGDRVLGYSFLEDKQHRPQSPICDAIIDFSDSNERVPQGNNVSAAVRLIVDGSFDVFDLSESPPAAPGKVTTIDSLGDENVTGGRSAIHPSLITPYPSPTQTLLDYPRSHWILPNYITPIPRNIADEDMQYLNSKGVFDIPDTETIVQLLRAYVQWVHPFAPMLDLEETLTAIFSNGGNGTLSLLLFQSMLFVASAYIQMGDQQCNRKSARKAYYERARLLHDFDVETDRLSTCQAAIMLSFWDGQADSVRDSYHWIGVATLHATSLGLDSTPTESPKDSRRYRTCRKTWWTLLVRDRLLAVAVRRPVQNKVFRFDVPMLHMLDFQPESFVETVRSTLQIEGTVCHMETIVSLWMALAQLSEYIDKVLGLQYVAQRTWTMTGQGAAVISLVPRTNALNSSEIMACGQELQNWYGYLPKEAQQIDVIGDDQQEMEMIRVHRALLAGYYSMTLLTLYRPQLNLLATGPNESKLRNESMKMVLQATKSITEIFGNLYAETLISRLPDTAVAVLEPAVATHLLNSTSEIPTIRDTSFQKFYLCWRILLQLKQTYYLAETTMSMLDAAGKRLKSPPDFMALKTATFPQLMEELTTADEEATKSYMTVPFIGVVGEQKTDRSDVAMDWTKLRQPQHEPRIPPQGPKEFNDLFGAGTTGVLEQAAFDQLVCWDDLEDELPP